METQQPVMQQPRRPAFSRNARLGIMAAIAMLASTKRGGDSSPGNARHGKHHGRTRGAFGKQR